MHADIPIVVVDLHEIAEIARTAGRAILKYYRSEFHVSYKEDQSPITIADREAHQIIQSALQERYPDIPCISEEGDILPYTQREKWHKFWLVDPLDGTREFVRGHPEFTVNIALIDGRDPVLGVIQVPVTDTLYMASKDAGAWKQQGLEKPAKIRAANACQEGGLRVVESRSHLTEKHMEILNCLPVPLGERRPMGSSLKLCVIAEGEADFYIRPGSTWEWDTAAGHAILVEAGGHFINPLGIPIRYNNPSLMNSSVMAVANLPGEIPKMIQQIQSVL